MKILVLGISGMLGSTIFKYFNNLNYNVLGTIRGSKLINNSFVDFKDKIITEIDAKKLQDIEKLYKQINPNIIINCIGSIKQVDDGNNPLEAIPINSLLPHFLASLVSQNNGKLIHFSTDCVFSGKKGNYTELDIPDVSDIYGRSKLLGEVSYGPCITLRTSIIGHELTGNKSLVSWFLSQKNSVKGFKRAIYSGLPAVEIANIIRIIITKHMDLTGLYHVASEPISKYDLLSLVKKIYQKDIIIEPSYDFKIDRSLDAFWFNKIIKYTPPKWEVLIKKMYDFENGRYENV